MENLILPRGPKRKRPGPVWLNARAHATHGVAHARAWLSRATMARDGEARARRSPCKNALELPSNSVSTKRTILTVS